MLSHRADVKAVDKDGRTALHDAAKEGHKDAIEQLLSHGADVRAVDKHGQTALHCAAKAGYTNAIHEDVIMSLFRHGADVTANDNDGRTALYDAIEELPDVLGKELSTLPGRALCRVKLLLDLGADVNAQGGYYGNALQAASWKGHEAVVRFLLTQGADVNAQGGYYGNALQAASWKGHEAVVRLLLDQGADVNAQGGYYGNALQAASCNRHVAVAQLLLEAPKETPRIRPELAISYPTRVFKSLELRAEGVIQVLRSLNGSPSIMAGFDILPSQYSCAQNDRDFFTGINPENCY